MCIEAKTKKMKAMAGNEAGAEAMRQINPDVAAVFPITPQTELMHAFAQFVADGVVDTELITVESEHSAMSATVGASAAGARAMTATSANGLALMWEIVYITASLRLPIVMPVVNRALSGPINIHCDHSDTMGCRDSGWIQLFSENSQEVYDNMIQAVRIAEHPDVQLPVMVTLDGFIISHAIEILETLEDKDVKDFVGEYKPRVSLLNTQKPITIGPLDLQDYYIEHKRQQTQAMKNAKKVVMDIGQEFGKKFERPYEYFESYMLEDAEVAMVVLGSTAGTAKAVVNEMRKEGHKVGLLKIRMFRPFPAEEIASALKNVKAVAVMDRSDSFGAMGGPVFTEVRAALCDMPQKPLTKNYIYGLGGRDINTYDIKDIFMDTINIAKTGKVDVLSRYFGVRGDE